MKDAVVQRKKIRVKTLMLLSIFLTVTVGFTATIGFMMWQWMAQQEVLAKNHIRQIAEVQALQVSKQLDSALTAARDMGNSALALREAGVSDRQSLNQLLIHYLSAHPQFLSMSMAFEPNAFDDKDAVWAGQSGEDPAGRYARYVDRDATGKPALHLLTDIETPGSGDYYLLPKQRHKDVIIEPYIYPYNGVDVMLTSIAAPIMRDGQFLGSVTSDFSLATLQSTIGAIKPWNGTGYALLLSAGNNVVSSPDKGAAGKPYAGHIAGHDVTRVNDPLLKEEVFITWQAITVGNSQTPWKLAIITPVSAAIGMRSITGAPTNTIRMMASAATTPATRLRAPALMFTSVCAIIGQPPMPEKKPLSILDAPCATASREPLPLVSVISSTRLSVSSPSVKPTAATTAEYGRINLNVSQVSGMEGIWKCGSVPLIGEISPTVLVSIPKISTMANTTMMAASEEGNFLVILGNRKVMATVIATSVAIVSMALPCSSTFCPPASVVKNC